MYLCNWCKATFEEPTRLEWFEKSEAWGATEIRAVHEDTCPYCGNTDIDLDEADPDAEESPVEDHQLDPVPEGAGEPPGDPDGSSGQ